MRTRCFLGVLFLGVCFLVTPATAETVSQTGAGEPSGVVYLKEGSLWRFGVGAGKPRYHSQLLSRQLFRQAMLIGARDGLGLTTRDAAIGDPMPAEGTVFVMGAQNKKTPRVFLRRIEPNKVIDMPFHTDGEYLRTLAIAEAASRDHFVHALKDFGFSGRANRRNPEAKTPERAEQLLTEMTFTSQFEALRLLHQAIRRDGESDVLLGAIARGYANLGWLTENQWLVGRHVFKARALLYAQRMVARGEHPGWAHWHRAYALAAVGLHANALADIETACKTTGQADGELLTRRPLWGELIEAHCRFESAKLDGDNVEPSCGQLAELLRLITVELSNPIMVKRSPYRRAQNKEAALAAVRAMPECYRASDSLCLYSGVGVGHRASVAGLTTMGRKIYSRLSEMPGLSLRIRKLISAQLEGEQAWAEMPGEPRQEWLARSELVAALMGLEDSGSKETNAKEAVGDVFDKGEPSWATLGYLIREISFLQTFRRVRFLKKSLGVSPDSFLEAAEPLVVHHPYRAFIETYANDPMKRQDALQRMAKLDLKRFDMVGVHLYYRMRYLNSKRARQLTWYFTKNSDDVARERILWLGYPFPREKTIARLLHKLSPYCPVGRAALLKHDWDNYGDKADSWEKEARDKSCYLLGTLATKYSELDRPDDAIRCRKEAFELSPDRRACFALVSVYEKLGKEDEAVATLEDYLQMPDQGLGHSAAKLKMATIFMNKGEWEKALPHAEEGARAYSAAGLMYAGECHEGLCHWDVAENYYRAMAERYDDSRINWYFFCRRTGKGDLRAAKSLAREYIRDPSVADTVKRAKASVNVWSGKKLFHLGMYRGFEGDPKGALECYELYFTHTPKDHYVGIQAALAADEVGDTAKRDKLLKQVVERGDERFPPGPKGRDIWSRLAGLMLDDLAAGGKGNIDIATYERIVKPFQQFTAGKYHWCFGKYLQLHGQEEKAVHYWKRCLQCRKLNGWQRTLAGAELVARGHAPDCYKTLEAEKEKPGVTPDE